MVPLESDLLDRRTFLVRPLPQPTPVTPCMPALAHPPWLPRLLLLPIAFQVPTVPNLGSKQLCIDEYLKQVAQLHDEESPGVPGE